MVNTLLYFRYLDSDFSGCVQFEFIDIYKIIVGIRKGYTNNMPNNIRAFAIGLAWVVVLLETTTVYYEKLF